MEELFREGEAMVFLRTPGAADTVTLRRSASSVDRPGDGGGIGHFDSDAGSSCWGHETTEFSEVITWPATRDPCLRDRQSSVRMLLTHLPSVARHNDDKPMVWRLHAAKQRPRKIGDLKSAIEAKSGVKVDDYRALGRPCRAHPSARTPPNPCGRACPWQIRSIQGHHAARDRGRCQRTRGR
jgi:hypothetical protein